MIVLLWATTSIVDEREQPYCHYQCTGAQLLNYRWLPAIESMQKVFHLRLFDVFRLCDRNGFGFLKIGTEFWANILWLLVSGFSFSLAILFLISFGISSIYYCFRRNYLRDFWALQNLHSQIRYVLLVHSICSSNYLLLFYAEFSWWLIVWKIFYSYW